MGRKAEKIDAAFGHVDGFAARGLDAVAMEESAVFVGEGCCVFDGLDDAGFVIHIHDRDEGCFFVF